MLLGNEFAEKIVQGPYSSQYGKVENVRHLEAGGGATCHCQSVVSRLCVGVAGSEIGLKVVGDYVYGDHPELCTLRHFASSSRPGIVGGFFREPLPVAHLVYQAVVSVARSQVALSVFLSGRLLEGTAVLR